MSNEIIPKKLDGALRSVIAHFSSLINSCSYVIQFRFKDVGCDGGICLKNVSGRDSVRIGF